MNLRRARFFLFQLQITEGNEPFDLERADAYLSATLVFGKAARDWMTARYRDDTLPEKQRNEAWWKEAGLAGPKWKHLADTRAMIVHEDGTVETDQIVSVTGYVIAGSVRVSGGIVHARVIPADMTPEQEDDLNKQWLEEKERIEEMRESARVEHEEWKARIQEEDERKSQELARLPHIETKLVFVSDPVAGEPVVTTLERYLSDLEQALAKWAKLYPNGR